MKTFTQINEKTSIPILWVGSIVFICCFGLICYLSLKNSVEEIKKELPSMVSREQLREWRDDLSEKNPALIVPRIPKDSRQSSGLGGKSVVKMEVQ